MSGTTVKLDGELLRAISMMKPARQTLSSYVREALRRDLRRQQIRDAAETYKNLLRTNLSERNAMNEWEAAPLGITPRSLRRIR